MEEDLLVLAARRGEDEAFYSLISLYKDKMYRIAFSYLKNDNEALEAIQEVTCRAYVRIRKLKEPRYFGTWLIRILLNYCIDELKKRKRTNTVRYMDLALYDLPSVQNDASIVEKVLTLDKPEGTIKTWLHKALRGLRQRLNKEGETL